MLKLGRYLAFVVSLSSASCTHYEYANDVKLMGFEEDMTPGKSMGSVRGEDCAFGFFGYKLGHPSIDKAFADVRMQQGSNAADVIVGKKGGKGVIKYVKNVSTMRDGFDVWAVSKDCLIVMGAGYQ